MIQIIWLHSLFEMANITRSSHTSSGIEVFTPNLPFLVIAYSISISAIILNSTEICLILRKWKKATDFEVLLFHLAVTDLLSSTGNLSISILFTHFYLKEYMDKFYMWVTFGLVGFFYVLSMKLILIIGFERLCAVKLPLKHRLWHSDRKNLYRKICGAWILNAILVCGAVVIDYFIQSTAVDNDKGQHVTVSHNLGYAVATYMSCGVLTILIIYTWVSRLVVVRAANLLSFDKNDYKHDPKIMKLAKKKERATIIICRMVLVTFLACNVPVTIALYFGKFEHVSSTLSHMNAVVNPLIYFFKGYIENKFDKRKVVENLDESGGTKHKSKVVLPQPASNTPIELGIMNNVEDHGPSNRIHHELRGSVESSSHKPSRSDTVDELGLVNEVHLDLPKSTDQVPEMKDNGKVASSETIKTSSSLDLGIVNATMSSFDMLESDSEKLEGSTGNRETSSINVI